MTKRINTCIERVANQSVITPDDLPKLALYMDQIISLMDEKLQDNKKNESDKIMTKTMINNYSKGKIIKPIKGKTYSREQVLQILMIYTMKNTLSLQQMKQVMQTMWKQESFGEAGFERVYNRYLEVRTKQKTRLNEELQEWLDCVGTDSDDLEDAMVEVLCLASLSDCLRRIAEQMIETYFSSDEG